MGFVYTIQTKVLRLKKDTPFDVIDLISDSLNSKYPATNSEHAFFKTERWRSVFSTMGYSGYEKPFIRKLPNGVHELFLHADIKYGYDEIHEFINWITPFISGHKPKEYAGWYKHDDCHYKQQINLYINRNQTQQNNLCKN